MSCQKKRHKTWGIFWEGGHFTTPICDHSATLAIPGSFYNKRAQLAIMSERIGLSWRSFSNTHGPKSRSFCNMGSNRDHFATLWLASGEGNHGHHGKHGNHRNYRNHRNHKIMKTMKHMKTMDTVRTDKGNNADVFRDLYVWFPCVSWCL